jgi:hypothetical protein
MNKRTKFIYLGIAAIIVSLYLVLTLLFVRGNQQQTSPPLKPTPTLTGSPLPVRATTPPIDQLKKEAGNKENLTPQEKQLRSSLVSQADPITGSIYSQATFSVFYLRNEDIFQIRITNSAIATAKTAALAWFNSKGISPASICKLPVFFYINPRLLNSANANDADPMPKQCQ